MKLSKIIFTIIMAAICLASCKKYLDAKPNIGLQVPSTLADLQALLDFTTDMNLASPVSLEIPADDCTLLDITWNGLPHATRKNLYIWEKDVFNDILSPGDWAATYIPVYRANVVLETLEKINRTTSNANQWDQVKGAALVFRARGFYDALQVWAKGYDKNTASTDLGIPLRLSSNFNEVSKRATVLQCYQQILGDLNEGVQLLPTQIQHIMRPSKPAAYGWLARTYLAMQEYTKAGENADLCLKLKNTLIDYNKLSLGAVFPFDLQNEELIFSTAIVQQNNTVNGRIDGQLYGLYEQDDLRKQAFFKTFITSSGGGIGFKGSYFGDNNLFTGIATNEMYLIRAECNARAGNTLSALNDLNALLTKRYANNKYQPYTLTDANELLLLVLKERRKELLFRGLRWTDLKRLNKEAAHAITIRRFLNGLLYELPPNDKRYAFSIPNSVIEITGMPQN